MGGEAEAGCGGASSVTIAMRGRERHHGAGEGAVGHRARGGHVVPEDTSRSRGAGNQEAASLRSHSMSGGGGGYSLQ